ncbi:MAG: hypothetical protein AAF289_04610 [Cyanobacteria bacterium P01_A01_bin.135]
MTITTYAPVAVGYERFGIRINYDKNSVSPSRVFIGLSKLIEATESSSRMFLGGLPGIEVEPALILERVQEGSITAWLRNTFKFKDSDKSSINFNPKAASRFLQQSNITLIEIGQASQSEEEILQGVERLRSRIYNTNKDEIPVTGLPIVTAPKSRDILMSLQEYQLAEQSLLGNGSASYVTMSGVEVSFDFPFEFSSGAIQDALTAATTTNVNELILKVKKPDYLGSSMWEFKLDKNISASISDEEWLERFRNREITLLPGDSIRAQVQITINYDKDGEVISQDYDVVEVLEERHPLGYGKQLPIP